MDAPRFDRSQARIFLKASPGVLELLGCWALSPGTVENQGFRACQIWYHTRLNIIFIAPDHPMSRICTIWYFRTDPGMYNLVKVKQGQKWGATLVH